MFVLKDLVSIEQQAIFLKDNFFFIQYFLLYKIHSIKEIHFQAQQLVKPFDKNLDILRVFFKFNFHFIIRIILQLFHLSLNDLHQISFPVSRSRISDLHLVKFLFKLSCLFLARKLVITNHELDHARVRILYATHAHANQF